MEAIEFAVKFDDGARRHGLDEADIVLVGVSRTSKTPLSMYLGYLGHKTANMPIVKGIEPPSELFEIDRDEDRRPHDRGRAARRDPPGARARDGSAAPAVRRARGDLRGARGGRDGPAPLGCPVIDVSDLSIEETAHRIIRLVEQRRSEAELAEAASS